MEEECDSHDRVSASKVASRHFNFLLGGRRQKAALVSLFRAAKKPKENSKSLSGTNPCIPSYVFVPIESSGNEVWDTQVRGWKR